MENIPLSELIFQHGCYLLTSEGQFRKKQFDWLKILIDSWSTWPQWDKQNEVILVHMTRAHVYEGTDINIGLEVPG